MSATHHTRGFSGPVCWAASAMAGAVLGAIIAWIVPSVGAPTGNLPSIPLWLCLPFATLLLAIAITPFISASFWHTHYPDVAFFLGTLVLAYFSIALGAPGRAELVHVGLEYYSFIALIGGLFVASGGVLVHPPGRGTPLSNTVLLAVGAVLANIVGTTGASVLLIRPFLRLNKGRLRPIHIVFFIFIVSNCGGCLTPIGDPPLYLGFLKGVPFFWTVTNLWPMWLAVNGVLLAMFFVVDTVIGKPPSAIAQASTTMDGRPSRRIIVGWRPLLCLLAIVGGVFIDPMLRGFPAVASLPIGATFQIAMATLAFAVANPAIRQSNGFTFEPVKEVAFLFIGIFLTMAPALAYLREHAAELGLQSPTQYYFATGTLSAVLDNAPTYLSLLQVAVGTVNLSLSPAGIREFLSLIPDGRLDLVAISLGAVFFGAMTYIGNGPNFMVKSIVESAHASGSGLGVRMPSFFGYLLLAVVFLLPTLVLNWFIFIR